MHAQAYQHPAPLSTVFRPTPRFKLREGRPPTELDRAIELLGGLRWPQPHASRVRAAFDQMRALGVWVPSWSTLQRARRHLGIRAEQVQGDYIWHVLECLQKGKIQSVKTLRANVTPISDRLGKPATQAEVRAYLATLTHSVLREHSNSFSKTKGAAQRPAGDWWPIEERLRRYAPTLRLNRATRQRLRNASDIGAGFIAGVVDRAYERALLGTLTDPGGWVWDQCKRFRSGDKWL